MRFPLILTVIEALFEAITCNLTMCGCIIMILHEKKMLLLLHKQEHPSVPLCLAVTYFSIF